MQTPSDPDTPQRDSVERPPESAEASSGGAGQDGSGGDEPASAGGSRSMWERLGRNVGKGLRAAKEVGSKIGEEANSTLSRSAIADDLDSRYRVLGRIVAEQLLEWRRPSIAAADPAIREVLGRIREQRDKLRSARDPGTRDSSQSDASRSDASQSDASRSDASRSDASQSDASDAAPRENGER